VSPFTLDQLKLMTVPQVRTLLDDVVLHPGWMLSLHTPWFPNLKREMYFQLASYNLGYWTRTYDVRVAKAKDYDFIYDMTRYQKASGYEITVFHSSDPRKKPIRMPSGVVPAWRRLGALFNCDVSTCVESGTNELLQLSLIDIDPEAWPMMTALYIVVMSFIFRMKYEPLIGLPMRPVLKQMVPP